MFKLQDENPVGDNGVHTDTPEDETKDTEEEVEEEVSGDEE